MTVLSGVSDRMEAAPGVLEALDRGLTHPNQASDWRATVNGTRICNVEGCEAREHGRGYCGSHYKRLMRYGDPTFRPPAKLRKVRQPKPLGAPVRNTIELSSPGFCRGSVKPVPSI